MELGLPLLDIKNAHLQGGRRQRQYFIADLLFLFRRFSVSVDNCFLERSSCAARDRVKYVRVQLFAVLFVASLGHDDAQPASGFRKPNAVYLEHPVKGDGRIGFDLATSVGNVVNGDFHI